MPIGIHVPCLLQTFGVQTVVKNRFQWKKKQKPRSSNYMLGRDIDSLPSHWMTTFRKRNMKTIGMNIVQICSMMD